MRPRGGGALQIGMEKAKRTWMRPFGDGAGGVDGNGAVTPVWKRAELWTGNLGRFLEGSGEKPRVAVSGEGSGWGEPARGSRWGDRVLGLSAATGFGLSGPMHARDPARPYQPGRGLLREAVGMCRLAGQLP